MTARALGCFRAQTYKSKFLVVFDNGMKYFPWKQKYSNEGYVFFGKPQPNGITIGELRNEANGVFKDANIIVHLDSDDWSHPNRIAEQVALLQASGAEAVGYNEMLFWRTIPWTGGAGVPQSVTDEIGLIAPGTLRQDEAWLYRNPDPHYAIGTSLCYWRETWKRKPFPALPRKRGGMGEDHAWIQGMGVFSESSVTPNPRIDANNKLTHSDEPLLIASIHGGNSMPYDDLDRKDVTEWTRVPEWDEHCREVMAL
jgi:hypothetical protein